jgi:hypothetical protein
LSKRQVRLRLAQPGLSKRQVRLRLAQPGLSKRQVPLRLAQPGLSKRQVPLRLAQPGLSKRQVPLRLAQPGLSKRQVPLRLAQPGLSRGRTSLSLRHLPPERTREGQANVTYTPLESALTASEGKGSEARKLVLLPVMSKVAPWQGQRNPAIVLTKEIAQHWSVQDVERATYFPGAVHTTTI